MLIGAKQIRKIIAAPVRVINFLGGGYSSEITSALAIALSTAGQNSSAVPLIVSPDHRTVGVIAAGATNRVELFATATRRKLADLSGNEIYGRLTESGGVYSLSYYSLQNGVEVTVFLASTRIGFEFNYRYDFARLPADFSVFLSARNVAQDPATRIVPVVEQLTLTDQNQLSALSYVPLSLNIVVLTVNGVTYDSVNFAVSLDRTITWNEIVAGFDLMEGDRVIAQYFILN